MIQDIAPKKLYNQFVPEALAGPEDTVLVCDGAKVLCRMDETIHFPKVRDLRFEDLQDGHVTSVTDLIYLFRIDDICYYLYRTDRPEEAVKENAPSADHMTANAPASGGTCGKEADDTGYHLVDLRALREVKVPAKDKVFAANTAKHLADWYRDNQFCGRCGHAMDYKKSERAMICPVCGYTAYPRIMPAVIVGVVKDDRLLITRYRTGYRHNALIAGFTEIGETLEETVQREVMEEAGIQVQNIRYYKSQPWGVANDILVGYFCQAVGEAAIHMDANELKYAEWTAAEDIVLQPDEASLTNEMMKLFKEHRQQVQAILKETAFMGGRKYE